MNDSKKISNRLVIARRLLILAGAVASGFLVAIAANQVFDCSGPGLRRRTQLPVNSNSLQSWLSFNKQTGSLGITVVEVEQVRNSPKVKQMELKEPDRFEISSSDEAVVVKIIEHKDPDISESGKDEFKFEFEGDDEDFDAHELEAALSKALRSGLRDADEIAKAVSETLSHHHKKKPSDQHLLPQQAIQEDKP